MIRGAFTNRVTGKDQAQRLRRLGIRSYRRFWRQTGASPVANIARRQRLDGTFHLARLSLDSRLKRRAVASVDTCHETVSVPLCLLSVVSVGNPTRRRCLLQRRSVIIFRRDTRSSVT